jgi:hypothetical protein
MLKSSTKQTVISQDLLFWMLCVVLALSFEEGGVQEYGLHVWHCHLKRVKFRVRACPCYLLLSWR